MQHPVSTKAGSLLKIRFFFESRDRKKENNNKMIFVEAAVGDRHFY